MNKLKLYIVTLITLFFVKANGSIDFNNNCHQAFDDIIRLKLSKANNTLKSELEKKPENAYALYLVGLSEIIQVFISENQSHYKKLQVSIPRTIKLIEKFGGKSPYSQLFKGQLLFYYGATQTKFEDFFSAGINMRDAYLVLKNNATKHPAFLPNSTIMGVIETFSGTVPASFKWIIPLFGIKPSVANGVKKLEKFNNARVSPGSELENFKMEAKLFLGGLYHMVLHKEKEGWELIDNSTKDWKSNLFSTYMRASFLIKTGENEEAIKVLSNRPIGKEYIDLYHLDYLLGVCKLNRLDNDADKSLINYITHFKGRNYLKSALHKLSWYYLIKGDYTNYQLFLSKIPSTGFEFTDEDKQATKSVKEKYIPNISLLRARLLFDGGYYDRALTELSNKSTKNYSEYRDQVEFIYRLGRIYQKQGRGSVAITYFLKAISAGKNLPHYYAMASSIEIGKIYEEMNDLANAKLYYKKALTFTKNKEYMNSLEQKAKAGIDRVSK